MRGRPTPTRLLALALLGALSSAGVLAAAPPPAAGQERSGRDEADVFTDEGEESEGEESDVLEDQDVDSDVRREGGGKVKVFRFSGLDVAGRLKSPQLLYFLNRLRAEFDRPRLPHRSFLPELQRSTKGKAF